MSVNDRDRKNAADEPMAIEFQSPGRFSVDNPPSLRRQPDPEQPAFCALGKMVARFESAEEASSHLLALLSHAKRTLNVCSPDFEPWLYNNSSVQQACVQFLLAHPRNRLRVLLKDSSRAVTQGHRLINLARRMSSNMQIRKLHPDYPVQGAFLLTDEHSALVRPEPDRFAGYALYQSPARTRQLQRQFDVAWDHSLSDPDLRSFLL